MATPSPWWPASIEAKVIDEVAGDETAVDDPSVAEPVVESSDEVADATIEERQCPADGPGRVPGE